jgi:hypothetical protein
MSSALPFEDRANNGERPTISRTAKCFDKKFWIAHGICLDSIIYDAELTHPGPDAAQVTVPLNTPITLGDLT